MSHIAATMLSNICLFLAYLDDLNGVKDEDKEVVWDLAPVWNGM